MKYYVAENTGKGFITHQENESAHVSGYPANVWVTENTVWAARVGAVEKTKTQAQALIDAAHAESVAERQVYIDTLPDGEEKTRLQEDLNSSTAPQLP